jgi:hypothetical protein
MAPPRPGPRAQPLSFPSRSPLVPRRHFRFSVFTFLVAILLSSQLVLCVPDSSGDDQASVTWVFPKGGETFYYLDTVNVSYQSSYSEPWLYIFCYMNETANTVRMSKATPRGTRTGLEYCQLTEPGQSATKRSIPTMHRSLYP